MPRGAMFAVGICLVCAEPADTWFDDIIQPSSARDVFVKFSIVSDTLYQHLSMTQKGFAGQYF